MTHVQNKLGKITIGCMMNQFNNSGFETMKITSLGLENVGGISNLNLENLNPQMNIICGENGVGKTNILDSIASWFSENDKNTLKKKVGSDKGKILVITDNLGSNHYEISIDKFDPEQYDSYLNNQNYGNVKKSLLYLKTNRGIDYKKISSIQADPDIEHRARYNATGINNDDIKDWLLNRILHSGHEKHLSEIQLKNLEFAKESFSLLNPDFKYSRLNTSNELFVNTPTGEIYFEYLSSGFKSIIYILLGIIKEIDYRLKHDDTAARDYNGIILIDEIELHLHPEWQGRICEVLKVAFPNAQFFISTHSPHVVQTALKGEVVALERKDGNVGRRELPESQYGYQGWTVEEILEDVMGMVDLRTQKYKEIKGRFDKALEDKDRNAAHIAYEELDKMLHPQYPLRPVFRMQLDSLGE
ncbi:AAA family ATPase [Acinetobacter baumannii]|jgi:predicted ATP-binding protein involved in virulence|nr:MULTISPECIES: AAA family ATPase [Acinetobacter]MCK0869087.1 AAA family ATPase [Acinetobacter pittii]MCK0919757.1 AAA family ATPase [Acinetobacter pittii]MCR0012709.1 AAA family ATPase [Acinetobacter baumannii]MCW1513421.1 AAA family ATPase [Acinetobacter baumannii]MCZ3368962.1 AAA family ATPase [Acinetobacter baumannii]